MMNNEVLYIESVRRVSKLQFIYFIIVQNSCIWQFLEKIIYCRNDFVLNSDGFGEFLSGIFFLIYKYIFLFWFWGVQSKFILQKNVINYDYSIRLVYEIYLIYIIVCNNRKVENLWLSYKEILGK